MGSLGVCSYSFYQVADHDGRNSAPYDDLDRIDVDHDLRWSSFQIT